MRFLLLISLIMWMHTATAQTERIFKLTSPNLTKDSLYQRVRFVLDFIHFVPHDKVADIGCYEGYYPALYSVFTDSIDFYLSDLNAEWFTVFDSIRGLCERIGLKTFTNRFYFSQGTDTSSNLEARDFTKVIVRDAFHHFKKKEKMLSHISQYLGPGGKLYLFEPVVPNEGVNNSLCAGAMKRQELEALLRANGFVLLRTAKGKNDHWWFEFSRQH